MTALVWFVSLTVDTYARARYRRGARRCEHWMSRAGEPVGPVCSLCGRSWAWRD